MLTHIYSVLFIYYILSDDELYTDINLLYTERYWNYANILALIIFYPLILATVDGYCLQ